MDKLSLRRNRSLCEYTHPQLLRYNDGTIDVSFLADASLHVNRALCDVRSREAAAMDLDEAVVTMVSQTISSYSLHR